MEIIAILIRLGTPNPAAVGRTLARMVQVTPQTVIDPAYSATRCNIFHD
jgi:hypothetical protein